MKLRDLEALKAAQRADLEEGLIDPEAHAGELTAGGRWRRARAWFSRGLEIWTARFEKLGKLVTAVAKVLGGLGVIGGLIWRAAVFYKTRGLAPAEQPKTGVSSTFADRVDKPKPP